MNLVGHGWNVLLIRFKSVNVFIWNFICSPADINKLSYTCGAKYDRTSYHCKFIAQKVAKYLAIRESFFTRNFIRKNVLIFLSAQFSSLKVFSRLKKKPFSRSLVLSRKENAKQKMMSEHKFLNHSKARQARIKTQTQTLQNKEGLLCFAILYHNSTKFCIIRKQKKEKKLNFLVLKKFCFIECAKTNSALIWSPRKKKERWRS